jgi:hypothetical protein
LFFSCLQFQFHGKYHSTNIVTYYQWFCQVLNHN